MPSHTEPFFGVVRPQRTTAINIFSLPSVCLIVGTGIVASALNLALPLFSLTVFNQVLPAGDVTTLVDLFALLVFALVCQCVIECGRTMAMGRAAQLLRHHYYAIIDNADGGRSHAWRQPYVQDIEAVSSFLSSRLAKSILDLPISLVFLGATFHLNATLGWLTSAAVAIVLAFAFGGPSFFGAPSRLTEKGKTEAQLQEAESLSVDTDTALVMGAAGRMMQRARGLRERGTAGALGAASRIGCYEATRDSLRYLLQATILAASALLVVTHGLAPGAIVAVGLLFSRALAPHDQLAGAATQLGRVWRAVARLRPLDYTASISQVTCSLPDIHGILATTDLTISAPGTAKPILDGITMRFRPGELVVVTGPEGSGKSVYLRALVGAITPSSGQVTIDGFQLHQLSRENLGARIGYVAADDQLGSGSLSEIISRSSVADMDQVVEAASRAGIHAHILDLPRGYATRLGPASLLSAGQRRRVAIARALFGDPRIVVLDNPTAGLDESGEADVTSALCASRDRGATVIVVSRSPAIFEVADRVIVLDHGRISKAVTQAQLRSDVVRHRADSLGVN